ncbi:hypothetical protein HK101_004877 [Irineochytrium annulatum]|nr:hypothetical protein HK101_004877 [Irineochytrium annulatum]
MSKIDKASLSIIPPNTTSCPLLTDGPAGPHSQQGTKRPHDDGGSNDNFFYSQPSQKRRSVPPNHYVCNICRQNGHWIIDCPQSTRHNGGYGGGHRLGPDGAGDGRGGRGGGDRGGRDSFRGNRPRDPPGCWFCLSNPKLEKHLIVTILAETYVALAKGGISSWGGHLLIVPMGHFSSLRDVVAMQGGEAAFNEMVRVKMAIGKAYRKRGESPVFYELYSGMMSPEAINGVQHMHMQAIPVPASFVPNVQSAFEAAAPTEGLQIVSWDGTLPEDTAAPYLRIELPGATEEEEREPGQRMVLVMTPTQERLKEMEILASESVNMGKTPPRIFNINFPRQVIATLMGCPDRAPWKACILPFDQEKKQTDEMRQFLKLEQ